MVVLLQFPSIARFWTATVRARTLGPVPRIDLELLALPSAVRLIPVTGPLTAVFRPSFDGV